MFFYRFFQLEAAVVAAYPYHIPPPYYPIGIITRVFYHQGGGSASAIPFRFVNIGPKALTLNAEILKI